MADANGASKANFTAGVGFQGPPGRRAGSRPRGRRRVMLVRRGDEVFAVGAPCTHYHGPLADGLVVGDTVRCPWHHACFSLRTGEALRAPALDPIACWRVERSGDTVFVREKRAEPQPAPARRSRRRARRRRSSSSAAARAGLAAAEMLRREGYDGPITMISADDAPPVDRPNLSKDYLAGTAPEDWIPLRPPEFYAEQRIELVLDARVTSTRRRGASACCSRTARRTPYGALLLATGADPVRLDDSRRRPARRSTTCARFADSRAHRRAGGDGASAPSSSAPASSASKSRRRCARAASTCTSSRPRRRRSSACMGAEVGGFIRSAARGARRRLPSRPHRRRASTAAR